ncbi:glycerophosphodiester phosphodiesterase family protein [Rhizobacter sp. Root404]|uniref:glycerophosphodiester phosphodiesterase family protein n=1 Tax=Rhizobacter sp. Root404 TaxID=1736528 RepID=UPI00138F3DF4|nr:glycerophosphodiester phosphodiesterase family protein [Rhizobacter sp. Root404]
MSLRDAMKLAALLLALCSALAQAAEPLVIAHRGASGYLPEHTLAGYELAIRMGADYIEPDLQMTRDGVLVAIHDDTLPRTTNVAELFAARNGGYRVADFTLAEIRTLTVKPTTTGAATYPGFTPASAELRVPTFDEVIALAKAQRAVAGRPVGLYPEAKQADPAMEDQLLATLQREQLTRAADRVFVQSFSDATVQSLAVKQRALGMSLPLVLLGHAITLPDGRAMMAAPGGRMLPLKDVAAYASGVGVAMANTKYPLTKAWIAQAHDAGLQVHGWTFAKLDAAAAADEYRTFLDMGLDGVFSNYSDLAVKARNAFVAGRK